MNHHEVIQTLQRILHLAEHSDSFRNCGTARRPLTPADAGIAYIQTTERNLEEIFRLAEDALCDLRTDSSETTESPRILNDTAA
jgi:hypothetical protein